MYYKHNFVSATSICADGLQDKNYMIVKAFFCKKLADFIIFIFPMMNVRNHLKPSNKGGAKVPEAKKEWQRRVA